MTGVIKGSRTLDAVALSMMVDAAALAIFFYTPEQLGVTFPMYVSLKVGFNVLQAWLRFKTVGPVGEK